MGTAKSAEIYQFKVTLIGLTPPIWRRIHVSGGCSLAQLHRALQVVMSWEDYYLYMFRIGSKKYGPPDVDSDDDLGLIDAKRARLSAVIPNVGATVTYVYDYGDDWEHELSLEAILMSDSDAMYPCCIAGERRCPPEDVGGIGGYTDYLEATADPNHEEHEQVMMWRGPFDPEECSVEKINQELAKKFRAKPRAATPHSITLTPKRSAKANRLTKTLARSSLPAFIPPHLRASDTALAFIRPIIPQRQRIRIKADETVLLELNQRERDLIISHTFANESLTDRLRAVTEPGQRPVFHFSLDELDELLGDVAAEANHVKNKVLQEQLDQLCERIEAVLSKYTDADI